MVLIQKIFYVTWVVVGVLCVALLGVCILVGVRIVELTYRLEELVMQLQQSGVLDELLRRL